MMKVSIEMSAFANIHPQIASILEILTRSAVTEICRLVDGSAEVLLLEMCRRQSENDTLRRKLERMEMELRAARAARPWGGRGCSRTVAVQADDNIDGDEGCMRTWGGNILTVVKEESSHFLGVTEESADTDMGRPDTVIIKAEGQKDESDYTESHGDLTVITAADVSAVRPGEQWQCEGDGDLKEQEVWPVQKIRKPQVAPKHHQGPSSMRQLQTVPATGGVFWTGTSSSRAVNVKPRFGSLGAVPQKEKITTQTGCGGGSASGAALSQQMNSVMSSQHLQLQRPADSTQGTMAAGNSFAASKGKMVKTFDVAKGAKQFSCIQCGKSFNDRFYLKIHRRIHTGERPFSCTQCEKRFYCTSHLIAHQRSHTGEKPYKCNECGNSYSYLNSLKLHQQSHTGEKPYTCDACGKSYSHLNSLKLHQRTHTGEKPYTCNECGKSYCHLNSLKPRGTEESRGYTAGSASMLNTASAL
ncbi:zinc finger protein 543-like isoform X6 [Brienomyrus brachyistius]|uniref:zinc finger protein 543-like isoform X6 n=1 Tax=Brienomyrus brachyistius TaxID=42636 RepID=UPI0020B38088|nr:zinc finger protein 543-like isoform X6 [Brienomyrus brachyistius]